MKKFKLRADQLQRLVGSLGYCYATDLITVNGERVGYMYREAPEEPGDSGWRFFSGTELQEYVDDPANTSIYDVNTIANYDPEIIPLLGAEPGSAFERDTRTGKLVAVVGE